MTFNEYWEEHGIKANVGALENAFREIAEKAWNASALNSVDEFEADYSEESLRDK